MIELLSHFGDDTMIVNVARVSYGKTVDTFTERDEKLLNYLWSHKHTSPFRHPQLQYRITCPIYVERQLFKHQVGLTANSISGRYVDFSDSYTKIEGWRKQSKSSKQGSDGLLDQADQQLCSLKEAQVIEYCKRTYDELIDLGVSKEQARTILPLNLNTTFIWTGSLMAIGHLFALRLKPDAQAETREVVNQMLQCLHELPGSPFKHTLKVWGYPVVEQLKQELEELK